jgi:hypothetical protein
MSKWEGVPLRQIPDLEERVTEYRRRAALQEEPRRLNLAERDAFRGKWEQRTVRDDETFRERAFRQKERNGVVTHACSEAETFAKKERS